MPVDLILQLINSSVKLTTSKVRLVGRVRAQSKQRQFAANEAEHNDAVINECSQNLVLLSNYVVTIENSIEKSETPLAEGVLMRFQALKHIHSSLDKKYRIIREKKILTAVELEDIRANLEVELQDVLSLRMEIHSIVMETSRKESREKAQGSSKND